MRELEEIVPHRVARLSGPGRDDAWHALLELGPDALPHILAAFESAGDGAVRLALVEIVGGFRTTRAVPFLGALLRDGSPELWKAALDGLVSLGDSPALEAVLAARASAVAEKSRWLDEAVDQIRTRGAPGGSQPGL